MNRCIGRSIQDAQTEVNGYSVWDLPLPWRLDIERMWHRKKRQRKTEIELVQYKPEAVDKTFEKMEEEFNALMMIFILQLNRPRMMQ